MEKFKTYQTLREISEAYATKQPHQIDYLLAGAPLLSRIPFTESTHGLHHVYEKLREVDGAAFVEIDQPLPGADVKLELGKMDLGILGFNISAGIDHIAQVAGKDNFAGYIAKKAPKIITKSGMLFEKKLAEMYKSYALKNKKVIDKGGEGNNTHTIFAIRLVEGENGGVYDPNGYGKGALFDTIPIAGGSPIKDKNDKTVYSADFKSYTGYMLENPNTVAIIANITDSAPIDMKDVEKLLRMVNYKGIGETLIIGNPEALKYINALKDGHYTGGNVLSTEVEFFNGIEIMPNSNFPESEKAVDITGAITMTNLAGKDTIVYGSEILKDSALPKNTSLESEIFEFGEGAMNSSILIRTKASADLTIADGKSATVEILHSSEKDGTYKSLDKFSIPAGTKKDAVINDYVLPPGFLGYGKLKVVTDDAAAAGTLIAYPMYLPR